MTGIEIEAEAEGILRGNALPIDRPTDPLHLAYCVVGATRVVRVPGLRVPARYVPATDTIELRSRVTPRAGFIVMHELSERHIHRLGYQGEDAERIADSLAACLLIPRRAMLAAVQALGRHLPDLSDALCASQSVVALRLGEVTGSPLALVTRRRVHIRGEEWSWPDEGAIRAFARGELPRELERVEVTDAARRVVLVAA